MENVFNISSLKNSLEIAEENAQLQILHFSTNGSSGSHFARTNLKESIKKWGAQIQVFEIQAEAHEDIFAAYRITQTPTVLIYRKGELMAKFIGIFPEHKLFEELQNLFKNDSQEA